MNPPLVSVICLSYNHEAFVAEALRSVVNQTYKSIEVIAVDDFSVDRSEEVIREFISKNPEVEFLPLQGNLGNCKAFNIGFKMARGEFIIDLAADDVLMPDRIEKGVRSLQMLGKKVGIQFSDAELIDRHGKSLGYHSDRFPHESIPQGDLYCNLLARYFINSPTMMIRREVLEKLGGYDESLAYEDFDFWVRSSRDFEYHYIPEPLVKKRMLSDSLGQRQYKKGSNQVYSTLRVCQKARLLNRIPLENSALKKRLWFEMRQALRAGDFDILREYFRLWRSIH